ncbi:hypothetical protein CRUP_001485, partial [Coryphaenoides rupestris]
KATSQLLLETDWESILQISKYRRSGDKEEVERQEPSCALYAFEVNCGQTVHDEVASKQTMEELKDLLKAWAHAFRNEPKYKVVQDTYQIMKAPDWVDAEECHRCRVQFGVMTRKHHCRACGQIFCGKCSSKCSTIPKFGIEKEVRVCEPCFEHLNKKAEGKASSSSSSSSSSTGAGGASGGPAELPPEYLTSPLSQQSQVVVQETMPPKRDEAALQEEEELQLAIALSQSEAEEKERARQKNSYSAYPKAEPTPVTSSAPPVSTLYSSPVLARYLNRTYWEKKQEETRKSPTPSAPAPVPLAEPPPPATTAALAALAPAASTQQYQNGESEEDHEQFLKALQNSVTTFLNRSGMGKGGGTFERLLDKATSQLLLETDWESILQISKYAIGAIKKKLNDKNPHVALYAFEVASKQTMEELKDLLKAWAHAFRNEPKYKVVQDTYQIMKAPDWVDAEECHRCRVQFGVMTRKHHCRACGQIFCGKCSSKCSTIPKFGIEKEVRVCEPCFEHLNKKAEGKASSSSSSSSSSTGAGGAGGGPAELPPEYLTSPLSQQSQVVVQETMPPKRDEAALQEEEELQLAIALSQSEAEEKERARQKNSYSAYPKAEPTPVTSSAPPVSTLYSSPVLARYLNRTYWEKKQEETRKSPTPSAPAPVPLAEPPPPATTAALAALAPAASTQQYQNGESEEDHEQFLKALQNSVTTFLNRVKSNHMRGRSITNDSAVLSLFQSINTMHPQLLDILNQLDEKRLYYEGLQDKLAQVRDARAALNALRDEHREKLRRAAEEAERQRQIQLAQKLEIMRQKKQEYLEMQRQLAIQRLQEQEKERQMRLEQQKHTPGAPPSYPGTFSPAGSVEGSPMHNVYMNPPGQNPPGQYQAMPLSATDPNMVNAYMYQTAGTNGQPAGPPGQAPPTTSPPYSSYQPTPTQGYQNVSAQPQSVPPMAPAAPANGMGYMGYQPYAMPGMMGALPGQDPNMPPPPQPYLAGQQPMYQQMAPPGGPPQQVQQQQPPQAVAGTHATDELINNKPAAKVAL